MFLAGNAGFGQRIARARLSSKLGLTGLHCSILQRMTSFVVSIVRCGGAGVDSDCESYFTVAYVGMRNGHCPGQSLLPPSYIKQYPVYYAGPAKAVVRMCFSKHMSREQTDRFTTIVAGKTETSSVSGRDCSLFCSLFCAVLGRNAVAQHSGIACPSLTDAGWNAIWILWADDLGPNGPAPHFKLNACVSCELRETIETIETLICSGMWTLSNLSPLAILFQIALAL